MPTASTSDAAAAYTRKATLVRGAYPAPTRVMEQRPKVIFEYTGRTAMAVIGGTTRLRYTFIKPGARVEVDDRDRVSMASVPNLKVVG